MSIAGNCNVNCEKQSEKVAVIQSIKEDCGNNVGAYIEIQKRIIQDDSGDKIVPTSDFANWYKEQYDGKEVDFDITSEDDKNKLKAAIYTYCDLQKMDVVSTTTNINVNPNAVFYTSASARDLAKKHVGTMVKQLHKAYNIVFPYTNPKVVESFNLKRGKYVANILLENAVKNPSTTPIEKDTQQTIQTKLNQATTLKEIKQILKEYNISTNLNLEAGNKNFYFDQVRNQVIRDLAKKIAINTRENEKDVIAKLSELDSDGKIKGNYEYALEGLGGEHISVVDKNNLALYRELINDFDGFVEEVSKNAELQKLIYCSAEKDDFDQNVANAENEASAQIEDQQNESATATNDDLNTIMAGYDHSGLYSSAMVHVDQSIRNYLGSLYKLNSDAQDNGKYIDFDTNNELCCKDTMDVNQCCTLLYHYGRYENVQSMIDSIKHIADTIPEARGFYQLATDLENNKQLAIQFYNTFGKLIISKLRISIANKNTTIDVANKRSNKEYCLISEYFNSLKYTAVNNDIAFNLAALSEVQELMKTTAPIFNTTKNTQKQQILAKLHNILKGYYPTITENTIENFVNTHKINNTVKVKDNIQFLIDKLKATIEASAEVKQNYAVRNLNLSEAYRKNEALDNKKQQGKYVKASDYVDVNKLHAEDYLTTEIKKPAIELAKALQYNTLIAVESNSNNVERNQVSDVINSSMLTNMLEILQNEVALGNYGTFKFQSQQYNFSNILFEDIDSTTGNVIYGLFKKDASGNIVPTSYAKELLSTKSYDGIVNEDDNTNSTYPKLGGGDYLANQYIAFFKTENGVDNIPMANYFMRTPSDAPKNFCIQAPRYSAKGLFTIKNSDTINQAIHKDIDDSLNVEKVDTTNAISLGSIVANTITDVAGHALGTKEIKLNINNYDRNLLASAQGKQVVIDYNYTDSDTIKEADDIKASQKQERDDLNKQLNEVGIKINEIQRKSISDITDEDNKEINRLNAQRAQILSKIDKLDTLVENKKKEAVITYKVTGTLNGSVITDCKFLGFEDNVNKTLLSNIKENNEFKTDKVAKFDNYTIQKLYNALYDKLDKKHESDKEYEVNKKHTLVYALKRMFKQELLDAANAINTLFVTDEKGLVRRWNSEEQTLPKGVKDGDIMWNEGISKNGKDSIGLYANYHYDKNGNIIKVEDGIEVLVGKVFESNLFTIWDEENEKPINFGQELLKEVVNFLYGGSDNSFIKVTKNPNTKEITGIDISNIEDRIDQMLSDYINAAVQYNTSRAQAIENLVDIPVDREHIAEFLLNYNIAYRAFDDMFEGNSKFYKSTQDLLKRDKEVQGSGTPYGFRDWTKPFAVSKKVGKQTIPELEDATTRALGINIYDRFSAVTIKNTVKTDEKTIGVVRAKLESLGVKEDVINNILLGSDGEGGYQNIKTNDAQSYISFDEFCRRLAGRGLLNTYRPLIEKIKSGAELTIDDIEQFVQVQKNFYFNQHFDDNSHIFAPTQIKNAEFVLIPQLIEGTQLQQVAQLMEKYGIDQLNTEETSKAGKTGVLEIFDAKTGEIKDDIVNELNGEGLSKFGSKVEEATQLFDYRFLYTQLETPQHMNSKNKAAIQIMKKLVDNISEYLPDGTTKNPLYDKKQLYFDIVNANVEESCKNLLVECGAELTEDGEFQLEAEDNGDFNIKGLNYKMFFKRMEEEFRRTGSDSNMLDFVTPIGDSDIPLMPNYLGLMRKKFESVAQAIVTNSVTRQKLPGFHAAQITNIGLSPRKEDNITPYVLKTDESQRITTEAYLKLSKADKALYRDSRVSYSKDLHYHCDENGNYTDYIEIKITPSAFGFNRYHKDGTPKTDEELLEEIQREGLDVVIGYRIPTEGKQSISKMKIVGFLNDAHGSTIVVPDAWVAQTGSDFDVDSVYGIQHATYIDKTGHIRKIQYKESYDEFDWFNYVIKNTKSERYNLDFDSLKEEAKSEAKDEINEARAEAINESKRLKARLDEIEKEAWNELDDTTKDAIRALHAEIKNDNLTKDTYIEHLNLEIQLLENRIEKFKDDYFEEEIDAIENYIAIKQETLESIDNQNSINTPNYGELKSRKLNDKLAEFRRTRLEYYTKLAEENNLKSLETYLAKKNENVVKSNSHDARTNKLIDIMLDILGDDSSFEENVSRSNFDDISQALKDMLPPAVKNKRENRSPYNPFDQADYQNEVMSGAKLKAFSVTRDTFVSICNTVKPTVNATYAITVKYSTNVISREDAIARYGIDNVNDAEEKGYIYITFNNFGHSNDNKNVLGRILTVYTSETTAHMLDSVKEGSIPNVNDYTFGVYKLFPDLGIDFNTTLSFILQNGMKRICDAYYSTNSVLDNVRRKPINLAIEGVAKDLGINTQNKNTFEIVNELANKYEEQFKKLFGDDATISLNDDDISHLHFDKETYKKKLDTYKTLSDEEKALWDLGIILQFKRLYNLSTTITSIANVCNPDKFGAKQSLFATRKVFEDIEDLLSDKEDKTLMVEDKHIIEVIYPNLIETTVEKDEGTGLGDRVIKTVNFEKFLTSPVGESAYLPLASYLKYSTAMSLAINNSRLFPTESNEFRYYIDALKRVLPTNSRLTEEINDDYINYVVSQLYNRANSIIMPIGMLDGNFVPMEDAVLRQDNEILNSIPIDNAAEAIRIYEQQRILGYGYSPIPTIRTKRTQNNQTESVQTENNPINIWYSSGENADLSNFAERPFTFSGFKFNNVEQAFHTAKLEGLKRVLELYGTKAAKTQIDKINQLLDDLSKATTGAEAKRIGNTRITSRSKENQKLIDEFFGKEEREYVGLKEWERQGSISMKMFIKASFEQNPQALQRLLDTGDAIFTHNQAKDSDKWKTEFPKLLMEVRDELRENKATQFLLNNIQSTKYTIEAIEDKIKWNRATSKDIQELEELRKKLNEAQSLYDGLKDGTSETYMNEHGTPSIRKKSKKAEFYSGGATGSDQYWGEQARALGYKVKDYTPEDWDKLPQQWKDKLDIEYKNVVSTLGRKVLDINSYGGKLVRRDMMQADKADAIFAIGTIGANGYVDGGTGYASTRGIKRGIPVYLFDQKDNQWKQWNYTTNKFEITNEPTLTPRAATIGTRQLQENGKIAIQNILKKGINTNSTVQQSIQSQLPNDIIEEKPFGVRSFIAPTIDDINNFVRLTPAQKVAFVKQYVKPGSIFDYITPNLVESGKLNAGKQTLRFSEGSQNIENIYVLFAQAFNNSNPFIALTAYDIVKYAFVAEGYTMKKNGVSKCIPNSILYNDINDFGTGIINELNNRMMTLTRYLDSENTNIPEQYIRTKGSKVKLPSKVVPYNKSSKTYELTPINKTDILEFDINNEDDVKLLQKYNIVSKDDLVKDKNGLVYARKLNNYIKLKFGYNGEETIYKVIEKNDSIYAYPLNYLEDGEHDTFSINSANNIYPSGAYYETIINNYHASKYSDTRFDITSIRREDYLAPVKKIDRSLLPKDLDLNNPTPTMANTVEYIKNEVQTNLVDNNDNRFIIYSHALKHYITAAGLNYGLQNKEVKVYEGTENEQTVKVNIYKLDSKDVNANIREFRENNITHPIKEYQNTIVKLNEIGITNPDNSFYVIEKANTSSNTIRESAISEGTNYKTKIDKVRDIAYTSINRRAGMMYNDKDAQKLKNSWKLRDIVNTENNQDSIIRNYAKYLRNRVDDLEKKLKYFVKDPDTGMYISITDPKVIKLIKTDDNLNREFLATINDADGILRELSFTLSTDIESDDDLTQSAYKQIQNIISNLSRNSTITQAKEMYANEYLASLSSDPRIKNGIMEVMNHFYKQSYLSSKLLGIGEISNPLVQIIMKTATNNIAAKDLVGQRRATDWDNYFKDLERRAAADGLSIDFDHIIDEDGKFIQDFDEKMREDMENLRDEMNVAKAKVDNATDHRSRTDAMIEYLKAKHNYDLWKLEHINQELIDDYYKIRVELDHRMLYGESLNLDINLGNRSWKDDDSYFITASDGTKKLITGDSKSLYKFELLDGTKIYLTGEEINEAYKRGKHSVQKIGEQDVTKEDSISIKKIHDEIYDITLSDGTIARITKYGEKYQDIKNVGKLGITFNELATLYQKGIRTTNAKIILNKISGVAVDINISLAQEGETHTENKYLTVPPYRGTITANPEILAEYKWLEMQKWELYADIKKFGGSEEKSNKLKELDDKILKLTTRTIYNPLTDLVEDKLSVDDINWSQDSNVALLQKIESLEAANSLSIYRDRLNSLDKDVYDRTDEFGFKEELERHKKIVAAYEERDANGNLKVPMRLLLENEEYVKSKKWIAENARFVRSEEFTKEINEAFQKLGSSKSRRAELNTRVRERKAKDNGGIIDGRKLTREDLAFIKQEAIENGRRDCTRGSDRVLLSSVPKADLVYKIEFYENLSTDGQINFEYYDIVEQINELLNPYYDEANQIIRFDWIPNTPEGIELYNKLADLYRQLDETKKKLGVDRDKVKAVISFRQNELSEELTPEEKAIYTSQELAAKAKGDNYYYAWLRVNRILKTDYGETSSGDIVPLETYPIPNPYIYHGLTPKHPENWVDVDKTNALKTIEDNYVSVPNEYYYMALDEARAQGEEAFKEWYYANHVFNPYTRRVEPLPCWTTLEYKDVEDVNSNKGEWVARSIRQTKDLKTQYKNPEYKENVGNLLNYKQGTGYDNPKVNQANKYELELKQKMQDIFGELSEGNELAKNYFEKGYLPYQHRDNEKKDAKFWGKEFLNFFGLRVGETDEREFYNKVDYNLDKTQTLPMLYLLDQQDVPDNLKRPVKEDNESEEDYNKRLEKYKEEIAELRKRNREAHRAAIDKNWQNVVHNFIIEASHANAINDNKQLLFYGLSQLEDVTAYEQKYGFFGDFKERGKEDKSLMLTKDKRIRDQYENAIRRLMYNQYKKNNGKLTTWANRLQGLTSAQYMMINIRGGFANVNLGKFQMAAEAAAGDVVSIQDLWAGCLEYDAAIPSMFANCNRTTSTTVIDALVKGFHVVDFDELAGKAPSAINPVLNATGKLNKLAYSPLQMGEHYMQNGMLIGALKAHRLYEVLDETTGTRKLVFKNLKEAQTDCAETVLMSLLTDKQKEEFVKFKQLIKDNPNFAKRYIWFKGDIVSDYARIALAQDKHKDFIKLLKEEKKKVETEFKNDEVHPTIFSQFVLGKDGKMAFKDGSLLQKYDVKREGKDLTNTYELLGDIRNRVIALNHKIHGIYDKLGQAQIEKHWWGSLVMQYHKHLPMGFFKHYRSKGYYNEERGTAERGVFNSIWEFLMFPFRANKIALQLKEHEIEGLEGVQNLGKACLDYYITHFWTSVGMQSDFDKANARRLLMTGVSMLWGIVGALVLKGADDDKEDTLWWNLAMYEMDRLVTEASAYNPFGAIREAKTLWSTPIAAESFPTDLLKVLGLIEQAIFNKNFNAKFKTGRYAGQNKFKVYLERRIPIWRGIKTGLIEIKGNNRYYKVGSNVLNSELYKLLAEEVDENFEW